MYEHAIRQNISKYKKKNGTNKSKEMNILSPYQFNELEQELDISTHRLIL